MPPSPKIKATLNEQAFEKLCAELKVTCPTVEFKPGVRGDRGAKVYGDYNAAASRIRIFLGVSDFEYDALRFATTECVRTLLHELRHHWQWHHKRSLFSNTLWIEKDAEGWAQDNVNNWKSLVRVSRSFPNSGFSRLSRHAR